MQVSDIIKIENQSFKENTMKKGLLFIFCLCLFVGCQNYKESYTRCENQLSSFCEYSTFLQDQDIDLLRSYNDAQQCIHYDMYRNEKLIFDFDVSLACQNNDIYWSNRYHALVTKDHGSDFENHIFYIFDDNWTCVKKKVVSYSDIKDDQYIRNYYQEEVGFNDDIVLSEFDPYLSCSLDDQEAKKDYQNTLGDMILIQFQSLPQ